MDEYLKQLYGQFRLSMGIKKEDFDPECFKKEFHDWLTLYMENGKLYFDWLMSENIIHDLSRRVAEIGKGEYDTVTLGKKTTLISPYLKSFERANIDNKVFNNDFTVFNGYPLFRGTGIAFDVVQNIDVFMTQNPYSMPEMTNWPQLYNYGSHDIIVGLYGNRFDMDISYKLMHLKMMRERIRDDFEIEEITKGDSYCYALSTRYTKFNRNHHNK